MNENVEHISYNPAHGEQWMTAGEVGRYLKMSAKWVYSHAAGHRKPLLASYKFGGSVRFKQRDVDEFVERLRRDQDGWAAVH